MKRISKRISRIKNKKINGKLIIVGVLVFIVVAIVLIRLLPTIKNIDVIMEDKDSRLNKEEILKLADVKNGDRLYKYLRSQIQNRIEENPYVKTATVNRDLSGKMTIKIKERKPTYMINYAGEYIYIDEEGYILEVNKESNNTTVIIGFITDFSGLSIGNEKIRLDQKDLEKLEIINNIFATLASNNVANKVNSVDITNTKNFILNLEDDGKSVYLGDGTDINTRVLYMKKILQAEEGNKGIIYVNKTLDEKYVYFKEQ